MKKSRISISLIAALLSVGALAGCDDNPVLSSTDGTILTYVDANGEKQTITADSLIEDYYDDESKYQSIYDTIYSLIVKNYFIKGETVTLPDGTTKSLGTRTAKGDGQLDKIYADAEFDAKSDKDKAKEAAKDNNTTYQEELDKILSSKGLEKEEELVEYYADNYKKQIFDDNFYQYHIKEIKTGDKNVKRLGTDKQLWNGYFKDMLPYHISHMLFAVEDSSGTNYANGTISEDNAKNLLKVIDMFKAGNSTFSRIASMKEYSADEGSAEKGGDLGIMDYSESFVDEFKLGIYAYENFFGDYIEEVQGSNIAIPGAKDDEGLALQYKNAVAKSFDLDDIDDVPTIEYKVFVELANVAEDDSDSKELPVLENNQNFYPRNIIYNKYLNRHSFAFITDDTAMTGAQETTQFTGFKKYESGKLNGLNVLSVKVAGEWTPVIATRGTSKQGIHFIVINRSPFAYTTSSDESTNTKNKEGKILNGVSLDDYYTTEYPGSPNGFYPKDANGNDLNTYVNFTDKDSQSTITKSGELLSKFKSYDSSRLNKYIFTKFYTEQNVQFKDSTLEEKLIKWINADFDKQQDDKDDAWTQTWTKYIDTLRTQNTARTKLVSQACKIGYKYANNSTEAVLDNIMPELVQAMLDAHEYDDELALAGKTTETDKKEWLEDEVIRKTAYWDENDTSHEDETVKSVKDLFYKIGGLCNDGKAR